MCAEVLQKLIDRNSRPCVAKLNVAKKMQQDAASSSDFAGLISGTHHANTQQQAAVLARGAGVNRYNFTKDLTVQ
jgi:hypothetical protein